MDELSLPEETETLRVFRQKLIEHKSALKTIPGEESEVDVRMNVYRPNPDGVRFVSAVPSELSAQARNRGAPVKPVIPDPFTSMLKVDIVRLTEGRLLGS